MYRDVKKRLGKRPTKPPWRVVSTGEYVGSRRWKPSTHPLDIGWSRSVIPSGAHHKDILYSKYKQNLETGKQRRRPVSQRSSEDDEVTDPQAGTLAADGGTQHIRHHRPPAATLQKSMLKRGKCCWVQSVPHSCLASAPLRKSFLLKNVCRVSEPITKRWKLAPTVTYCTPPHTPPPSPFAHSSIRPGEDGGLLPQGQRGAVA